MTKIAGHTQYRGYSWKFCPYSTQYKEAFYDNGYLGNSTNPNLPMTHTSDHDFTEGTMMPSMRARAWGFICMDDNCWFYQTYGRRYFES